MENEEFKDFLSKEETLKAIDKLNGFSWKQYDKNESVESYVKEIRKVLSNAFNILPYIVIPYPSDPKIDISIFRARPLKTFSNPSLLCEYSYKPISLTTELQRCNFPSFPVFYGSTDAGTALLEVIRENVNKDNKEKYLVSKWSLLHNTEYIKIAPYMQNDLPEENPFKFFSKIEQPVSRIFKGKLTKSQMDGLLLSLNYLAKLFLTENYSVSAALVHEILYADHNFRADLLVYPSFQSDKKTVNYAIHPNFVDNSLKLERVYSVSAEHIDKMKGSFNISIDRYAENIDSILMWKNISPEDERYREVLDKDFNFKGEFNFHKN